jgi:hypothetical protein
MSHYPHTLKLPRPLRRKLQQEARRTGADETELAGRAIDLGVDSLLNALDLHPATSIAGKRLRAGHLHGQA